MQLRRLLASTAAVAVTAASAAVIPASPAGAAITERWRKEAGGAWFHWSSPVLADLNGDGSNEVVVGGLDGNVYAYDANGGRLFAAPALGPVASSPAVGDLDKDGRNEIAVGTGSLDVNSRRGGLTILNGDGSHRCNVLTDTRHGSNADRTAVFNAPAIGDVDGDGDNEVVFGAWDHWIYAVHGDCSLLGRFENTDTVWSAPALYDIDGIAGMEIFIGGDATRDVNGLPHSGGYFRSLTWNGSSLVQRWVKEADEVFQSAAAIGDINNDGRLEVVTGSGADYCRYTDPSPRRCEASRNVWAWDLHNGSPVPGWPKQAAFSTFLAAPALGDINGDGLTDVVVGSTQYVGGNPTKGSYDAFLGGGKGKWQFLRSDDEAVAPPVIADVTGGGTPEVLVGISGQVFALNGPDGTVVQGGLGTLPNGGLAHKNAAVVGELGKGRWALVTAGFMPGSRAGYLQAYDLAAPSSAPWPQFRKNARRLGGDPSALGAPRPPAGPSTPVTQPAPPTTTTKPKPKVTTTTKRTAPPTTAAPAPPPPETTTTLAPETTTTLAPETTTTTIEDTTELVGLAGRESDGDDGGGGRSGPLVALLGLIAVGGGGLFFAWRRRHQG